MTLTAKDKICHMDERNCNPDVCEYAKGHFDRINDAVYDIITHESVIDREKVLEYSVKHKVCPFEMSLDVSYWCDGIICDYNYLFDPDASLKRYFQMVLKVIIYFLLMRHIILLTEQGRCIVQHLLKKTSLSVKSCERY